MTAAQVQQLLESTGAIQRGHFQLSSGRHSPVYVQCAQVLQHPEQAERLAVALAPRLQNVNVQVVAAPALGGLTWGYELARQLGARAIFVERESDGRFALRRFALNKGERVLVAEDVLTTGGSTRETMDVIRNAGGEVVGVAAIVDRSGGKVPLGVPLHVLLTQALETYAPADCPGCKAGQPLEKPGSRPEKREAGRQGSKEAGN